MRVCVHGWEAHADLGFSVVSIFKRIGFPARSHQKIKKLLMKLLSGALNFLN